MTDTEHSTTSTSNEEDLFMLISQLLFCIILLLISQHSVAFDISKRVLSPLIIYDLHFLVTNSDLNKVKNCIVLKVPKKVKKLFGVQKTFIMPSKNSK